MFKKNLGLYTYNQYTCFDGKKNPIISLLVCFPQIQATNGKLLGHKVKVPRLIISTELKKIIAVPGKKTSHFLVSTDTLQTS